MKSFKRIVGLLLCLAMVLSFVPVTHTHVHAAETVQPGTTTGTDPIKQGTVLELIPNSRLTPLFGYFPGQSEPNGAITPAPDDKYSKRLTDGWYATTGESYTAWTSLEVAMVTLDTDTTLGAVEIAAASSSGYDPKVFKVQVLVGDTWQTVANVTSNPFSSSKRTVTYTFDPVLAKAARVLISEHEGNYTKIAELCVYEARTGNVYSKIDLAGTVSDTAFVDGNKSNYTTATSSVTFNLTKNGQPTAIDRFALYPYNGNSAYPTAVTVSVQKTAGGSYTEIGEFETEWSASASIQEVLVGKFDQTYEAYSLKLEFDKSSHVTEFELYQYERGVVDPDAPPAVGAPSYVEVELNVGMLRGCSRPANGVNTASGGDYANATYYFPYGDSRLASVVDGNHSNTGTGWGIDPNERGDIYINLGSSTPVSRIVFYRSDVYSSGDEIASEFQVSLLVEGDWVTLDEVDTGLDTNASVGDSYVFDFGKTYSATAIYLWPTDCDDTTDVNWPGLELYQKTTVQLPTPTGLKEVSKTENSITVSATAIDVAKGTLEYQIKKNGTVVKGWQASGEFTGLEAGTTYTVEARYLAANGDYITTTTPTSIEVTTEEATKEPLAAPTIESVTTTDSTITVNATAAAGTLMYRVLLDGDEVKTWQTENVFTGLDRNTGYDVEVKCVPTDDIYAESEVVTTDATTAKTKLPAPTGLDTTEVTDTSITVTADANPNGTLYFRCGLEDDWGEWTTNPIFSELLPETKYVIHAMYVPNSADFEQSDFIGINVTTSTCTHKYDNKCTDTVCKICGEERVAPGHAYSNDCDATCNNGCGHIREVPDHVYDNACDESCNVCGEKREVTHNYDNGCDAECNDCGAIRDAEHTYDNDCDADCNECGYLRPDATGHKYDNNCDAICNNCGFERTAPHTFNNCKDTVCAVCGVARVPTEHIYTNECDPDCNICDFKRFEGTSHGSTHNYDSNCDDTCGDCGTVREAPHRYSSIYDTTCEDCGAVRTAQTEPDIPVYADKTLVDLSEPFFGYYSNGDTNGTITDCYVENEGPDNLIDNDYTKTSRAQSLYYNYKEIQQGIKIPVILFQFNEPTNVCAVDICGYAYSYYNMETFDVQVYTDGAWVNVAHITNAFTDGVFEDQVTTPLTVTFDQAYEATQLRILVRKVTNMLGRGDVTTGDDDFGFSAPFRVKEIDIYSTTSEPIDYPNDMTLNGTDIGLYKIVYTDELDYNLRAAEYLQSIIYKKTGRTLTIVEDDVGASDREILVGNTNRTLSTAWDAPDNQAMKFHIRTDGTKIVLEAEYFIIAGAAYYFGEKFVPTVSETEKTVPTERTELDPIIEPANNYIMMIGDGMGVMQTRLFEKYGAAPTTGTYGFSDGEEVFYGYYFPHEGRSRTWNILGQMTDSAAGGTALATGYKTTNGTVALDWYGNEVKSLTELALELGMSASVMSTEGSDGATPAAFSTHSTGRYDDEIITQQGELEAKYKNSTGQKFLFVDRYISSSETPDAVYKNFTAEEWARYEAKVTNALNEMDKNANGFFIMYEEAYIDKNQHNAAIDNTFKTLYRFNQAIGIFMEYAMYNPDTVVLITADHETGGLDTSFGFNTPNPPDESGYNHSTQDVPVFAYGFGTEVFATEIVDKDDLTGKVNGFYQNASIGRTFAHFMTNGHADDFGDPWYPILVNGTKEENYPYPEDPMKVTDKVEHTINISGKVTGSYSQTVARGDAAEITINLTNANGTPTNVKKMVITAANTTSAAPATTIVEAQVEVNGEKVWLQIYKDTLYGVMYGEAMTSGILDFHTSYNAYQIRITVNSLNTTGGYGTMNLSSIKLYGYDVETPDVGGVITDGGDENEDAVIKLMQDDEVKYTATIAGDNYYVMDVAAGDYTVVATKNGHITVEYDITVGSEPVRQDVVLKYVAESTITATSQCVRLIEPWAIRSYIQYAPDANSTDPVYLTSILGYGAYGIIEHKTGDAAPTSWEDIIYNEKAIKFEKSFTEGDEKISHTSNAGKNRRYTVMFDFYDMLYTYRMAEQVYWVTFYEDAEGVHFTNVYHISMSELIDKIKAEANPSETEEAVLDDMKTLHQELIEYRGADADLGNTPYPQGVKLSESGIQFEDVNTGSWQFGRRRQIRLIEPWGFKVTLRFKEIATNTILADPNATAADYGMIFFHDKIDRYINNGMSYETMLAQGDAMVFSKSLNNMIVDGDAVLAVYTKDIYTYQLDSELYCLPFIKIGNQYYVPQNAVCWNLLEEMETIRDDTVNRVEKERDVLAAMVNLYYDITKHLGYVE